MTKLTPELLYSLGFRGEGKDILNLPAYRLEVSYNSKNFENGYFGGLRIILLPIPNLAIWTTELLFSLPRSLIYGSTAI